MTEGRQQQGRSPRIAGPLLVRRFCRLVIIALTLFIAGGCLNPDGSFHDAEGNLLIATPEEIREGRQMLLAIKPAADMPPAMKGGVLFDVDVEAISGGPEASTMSTLRVVNRISGAFSDGDRVGGQTPSTPWSGVRVD